MASDAEAEKDRADPIESTKIDYAPSVDDGRLDEMKATKLRAAIGRCVGVNQNPYGPLTMDTLNSIYAYRTGEFIYEPRFHSTPLSPGLAVCRIEVAAEFGIGDFPFDPNARPFRVQELRRIAAGLSASEDEREWLP